MITDTNILNAIAAIAQQVAPAPAPTLSPSVLLGGLGLSLAAHGYTWVVKSGGVKTIWRKFWGTTDASNGPGPKVAPAVPASPEPETTKPQGTT